MKQSNNLKSAKQKKTSKDIKKLNELELLSRILASCEESINTLKNMMETAEHSTDPITVGNLQSMKDEIKRQDTAYKMMKEHMNNVKNSLTG